DIALNRWNPSDREPSIRAGRGRLSSHRGHCGSSHRVLVLIQDPACDGRSRVRNDVDDDILRRAYIAAQINRGGAERERGDVQRYSEVELVRCGGGGEYRLAVHQEVDCGDSHIVRRIDGNGKRGTLNDRATGSRRGDCGRRRDALVVDLSEILADVEPAVSYRAELAKIAVFGDQVDEVAVRGNAHAVVIALGEVEDGASPQAGRDGNVGNRNTVDELHVRGQGEVPGHNDVLQEAAEVGIENVRQDNGRSR